MIMKQAGGGRGSFWSTTHLFCQPSDQLAVFNPFNEFHKGVFHCQLYAWAKCMQGIFFIHIFTGHISCLGSLEVV